MKSLIQFSSHEGYSKLKNLMINLQGLIRLLTGCFQTFGEGYNNKGEKSGWSNIDEMMIRFLVLQQWHGASDPKLE